MKKILKISIIILLFVCMISLCGCLGFVHSKTYWNGIFGYTKSNSLECCLAAINGQNNQLEAIEIPDYIDGYKVVSVFAGDSKVPYIEHDYVKKLYIGTTVESISVHAGYVLFECKNLERIVINNINMPSLNFGFNSVAKDCVVAVPQEYFEIQIGLERSYSFIRWAKQYRMVFANIEYHYNFDDSENADLYKIDYLRSPDEVPYKFADPIREGYTFGGWYTDEECTTLWDNSVNCIFDEPINTKVYRDNENEEMELVTNKLKLYAKWSVLV